MMEEGLEADVVRKGEDIGKDQWRIAGCDGKDGLGMPGSKRVAVERNGQIVPKAQYDGIVLEDDDVVEIVSFVGGG